MTAVDRAELKRLAEGATPGPWSYRDMRPNTYGPAFVDASDVQSLAICGDAVGRSDTHGFCLQVDADVRMANAAFIAAANPAVVLALLSEIEGLKAERAETERRTSEYFVAMREAQTNAAVYKHDKLEAERQLADLRTQAPDSWRPIETAPKDGTLILAVRVGNHPETGKPYQQAVAWWENGRWVETDQAEDHDEWPLSHWMPLPSAPALRPQTAESGK